MSVDIEAVVVAFLLARSSVTAIAGNRVYTDLPHKPDYPLVLVSRTGGGSIYKNHLEEAELSIGALGTTHKVAYKLAKECISTMSDALVGAHPDGCVTKVKVSGLAYEPEPDSSDQQGHARPRYAVSVTVTAHP